MARALSDAICQADDAHGARAVGTAEDLVVAFYAVTDYTAIAMRTSRRERVDRAFEAVEHVRLSFQRDLEALVVVVAADLTRRHPSLPSRWRCSPRFSTRPLLERRGRGDRSGG